MGGSYRGHCQPPLANVTGAETLRRRAARRLAEAQRRFAALEPRVVGRRIVEGGGTVTIYSDGTELRSNVDSLALDECTRLAQHVAHATGERRRILAAELRIRLSRLDAADPNVAALVAEAERIERAEVSP